MAQAAVRHGNFRADGGALGGRRFDAELAADHFDPFPGTEQAQAPVPLGEQDALDLERLSVVVNLEPDAIAELANAHFYHGRMGMLVHVGERGLGDAVEDRSLGSA